MKDAKNSAKKYCLQNYLDNVKFNALQIYINQYFSF